MREVVKQEPNVFKQSNGQKIGLKIWHDGQKADPAPTATVSLDIKSDFALKMFSF